MTGSALRSLDSGGLTVVVGHAVTESGTVEAVDGRLGGRALFADTGAWTQEGMPFPVLDVPFGP